MGVKQGLCRASSGLFVRNLGWKVTPAGGYAQHKFYLGREEAKAKLASLRLEQLWKQVGVRWEREKKSELNPTDRPVWDPVTFAIAAAIRNGEAVARVPLPSPLSAFIPESPFVGDWLNRLQDDISVIKIELLDQKAQDHSQEFRQKHGKYLLDLGRRMMHQRLGGETLRNALDAYSQWIPSKFVDLAKKPTAWSGTQARQIAFIRRSLPDCELGELSTERIEELIEILRLRPNGGDGKPVSISWTQNCLKQFRHFLRWLSKAPAFAWKRPSDLELSRVRIPLTPEEKSARARSSQVQTYTTDELKVLWTHASAFQRLLLLLALNCGFGRAEVASLETADVHLRRKHPHERELGWESSPEDSWIFFVRHKTGVYGEYKLWPETVRAIEWWLRQRAEIAADSNKTTFLVNRNGQRYDAPTKGNHANFQIPNSWFRLTTRIRKKDSGFRALSFNKLRKTAGNLVRQAADGEVAAVFLCHGTPVKADDLLDLYTNRPFAKVFATIDSVGERLRRLWVGVPEPFPEDCRNVGPEASMALIRRIHSMKEQGYKTNYIAVELGLSATVVRKHLKGLAVAKGMQGPNKAG